MEVTPKALIDWHNGEYGRLTSEAATQREEAESLTPGGWHQKQSNRKADELAARASFHFRAAKLIEDLSRGP